MSSDDERKPRLHVHTGGLIILVIILLILFKVDIRSKIESPQFQKNWNYISEKVKDFWKDSILDPLKLKAGGFMMDIADKEVDKLKENISNNLLKTPTMGDSDYNLLEGKDIDTNKNQ